MSLVRFLLYFRPHFFSAAGGMAFMWGFSWVLSQGGSCRAFCQPSVALSAGLAAGLFGAQLYRSDHPLPPRRES